MSVMLNVLLALVIAVVMCIGIDAGGCVGMLSLVRLVEGKKVMMELVAMILSISLVMILVAKFTEFNACYYL